MSNIDSGVSRVARLARAMVARTVWDSERDDVVRNFDELYRRRRDTHGRAMADLWYWGQALTFGPRLWLDPCGRRLARDERDRARLAVWLDGLRGDFRFALRGFRRTPGFTIAAVATLALGIAANTVIYTMVRGAVLRPPPFPEPDRLVWIWPSGELPLTQQTFEEIQRLTSDVGTLTAFAGRGFAIQGAERPDEIQGVAVSVNHFEVMGRQPLEGRALRPEDGLPGGEPVALISHEIWQSHFAGDPSVLGRRIELLTSAAIPMMPGAFTGKRHSVIGVLPPDYRPFGAPVDVVTPLVADPSDDAFRQLGELSVVARLRPGARTEQLRAQLVSAARRLPQLAPIMDDIRAAEVVGFQRAITGPVRASMFVTLGAVAVVLLIACANVANLMISRTQGRGGELAVRAALGADRGRIARQLLTECAVLALAAGAVGAVVAVLLLPIVVPLLPHQLGLSTAAIQLDLTVLIFIAVILGLTLVVTGLVPALRGTTHGAQAVGGRRGVGGGRRANRANHALVVAELALGVMLASGAGLLLKSFSRLTDIDAGFSAHNVLTARVAPSAGRYSDPELRIALYERTLNEVRTLPGVTAAGAIHFLPIADGGPSINFRADPTDDETQGTGYRVITPGYLEAMEIPLISGRTVTDADRGGEGPIGLVNQTLAERLWPGQDAVGRRLYRTTGREWFTVVGVVGDVRQSALGLPPVAEAYLPLAQSEWASAMTIVVRALDPTPELARQVEDIIWTVDPDLPITRTAMMSEVMSASVEQPRFYSLLFGFFALLALGLGAIGIYGVVSSVIRQRRNEIGIRIALGATGRRILLSELGRALRLSILGIAVGLVGAVASSRALGSLLFEVSPFDPVVFAVASATLVTVTLLASLVPARRAASLDPVVSIRSD